MHVSPHTLVSCLMTVSVLACSRASTPLDEASGDFTPVIDGRIETGYPEVGYLVNRAIMGQGASCGVTLLSPRIVVTAAHCVQADDPATYAVGFGPVGSAETAAVQAIHRHPAYGSVDAMDPSRRFDLAVLELAADVEGRAPATIALPKTGHCEARYIGYGRTTVGGREVPSGYSSERKSASMCIDGQTDSELYVRGADGGLCWGDSGGPLMAEGGGRIFGILSRHAPTKNEAYRCDRGNRTVFTSLYAYRGFLSAWVPNAFEALEDGATKIDGCNVLGRGRVFSEPWGETEPIRGRVRVSGVTNGHGRGASVYAEVGYGPMGSYPDKNPGWHWFAASYAGDANDPVAGELALDEYVGRIPTFGPAAYDLAFRFSRNGRTWSTCLLDDGTQAELTVATKQRPAALDAGVPDSRAETGRLSPTDASVPEIDGQTDR